jgi:hypothetical protein
LNTIYQRYQYIPSYPIKIKIEIPKYDGQDDREAITWVNKIEGVFAFNPLANELEKILISSLHLEGDAYDWFTWLSKKTNGLN